METPSTHTSLLTQKHAVIFGAGGAVGKAVAKEFAAKGATAFLSGRTPGTVEQVAQVFVAVKPVKRKDATKPLGSNGRQDIQRCSHHFFHRLQCAEYANSPKNIS